jgi:hypothetical protein
MNAERLQTAAQNNVHHLPWKTMILTVKNSSPSICPSWQNVSTKPPEATHEFKSDAGGKSLDQKAKVQLCMRWRYEA